MISLFGASLFSKPPGRRCSTCEIGPALSRDIVLSSEIVQRQEGQPRSGSRLYRRYTTPITRISGTPNRRTGAPGTAEIPVARMNDTGCTHRFPDACGSAVEHQHDATASSSNNPAGADVPSALAWGDHDWHEIAIGGASGCCLWLPSHEVPLQTLKHGIQREADHGDTQDTEIHLRDQEAVLAVDDEVAKASLRPDHLGRH